MEVTGVVLGAVPLILYVLDNYKRVWGPVNRFLRWEETIETIKNEITLQTRLLDATLQKLDFNFDPDDPNHRPTLNQVEYALQIRCPDKSEDLMVIIQQMDNLVNQVAANLCPDAHGPVSPESPSEFFLF